MLKVSIVTPCLNPGSAIRRAIESVLSQSYKSIEYIVIDGGSTDGTLDLLRSIPELSFVSERDRGQADAMNKGIDICTGDIIGFLNADDYYLPGALDSVVEAFDDDTQMVVGNIIVKSERMNFEFVNNPRTTLRGMLRHWEPNAFCYNPVGYFTRIGLQKECRYNTDNYESMDLEFLLDVASRVGLKKIDKILGCFDDGHGTKTDKTQLKPDYWRPSTFPYIEKYLTRLPVLERQAYYVDRRENYVSKQAESNQRARERGVIYSINGAQPKISVIIPTYNDVNLLHSAIVSVRNQKYDNYEIIIVDDASNVPAEKSIRAVYGDAANIKIYRHASNKMLGGARNTGIAQATGDYIFFLDSDDLLADGALVRLVSIAEQCKADVVQGGTLIVDINGNARPFHAFDFASDGGIDGLEHFSHHRFASLAWNKLYRAQFLQASEGPRFIEGFAHEDVAFSSKVAYRASKIVSVSDIVYYYKYNQNSITRKTPSKKNIESYVALYKDIVGAIEGFSIDVQANSDLLSRVADAHVGKEVGQKLLECRARMGQGPFSGAVRQCCAAEFGLHGTFLAELILFFVGEIFANRPENLSDGYLISSDAEREFFNNIRPRIVIDGIFWQYNNTGIARLWANLLGQWVESGFSRHVLVLDRGGTAPRIDGVNYLEIERYDYNKSGEHSMLLEAICQKVQADLMVSTYYTCSTTTPSFFVGYDMIPEVYAFNMDEGPWREKRRAILHASAHSMISSNSADDLARFYPHLERDEIIVSYPGLSREFVPATADVVQSFCETYGLEYRKFVLFVGKRDGYKNARLILKALNIYNEIENLKLICVGGDLELEAELLSLAPTVEVERLSIGDQDLVAAYSGAYCLAYTSQYEGFGLPPIEAMACGTPVIVCRNSSIPESAGDAGLYVDSDDPSEAVSMLRALQDPEFRAQAVAKGLANAQRFSYRRMAEEMSDAFLRTCTKLWQEEIGRPPALWAELRSNESRLQGAENSRQVDSPEQIQIRGADIHIDFRNEIMPDFVAEITGFSWYEGWGRWTVGGECSLSFKAPLPENFVLELVGHCFVSNENKPIVVSVGGYSDAIYMLSDGHTTTHKIRVDNRDGARVLKISMPDPRSPAEITNNESDDCRKLGIAVSAIRIVPSVGVSARNLL